MKKRALLLPLLLVSSLFLAQTPAQDPAPKSDGKPSLPKETTSERTFSFTLNGTTINYTATAATLVLKDDDGKPLASFFYIAYTRDGVKDLTKRPLTFTFNGGPGSSSVWLHMGAFGPKRVKFGDDGEPLPPPYKLVDNEFSILDATDLVFIDPISTGYSRPAPGVSTKTFHGVQEDVQTVGDFIRLYTTRHKRWQSPLYLAGESYGTTRSAGLSGYLQERHGMNLSGIILVSVVLNFQTLRFDEGNDLPYPLFLPTYTATAWYHKKLAPELQGNLRKTLDEAEKFAQGDYTLALMKGDALKTSELQQVAEKMSRLTGLSVDYCLKSNLRVPMQRFGRELLRNERRTIGRFDSRYKGIPSDGVGDAPDYDPSHAAIQPPYTATFNHYIRNTLGFESDLNYEILTGKVQPWDYGSAKNRYLNVAPTLRGAMTKNANLRVFVANGYYDLATPYFATEYTFNHMGLDPTLRGHVRMEYYEAGHMMYVHRASHRKLAEDLRSWFDGRGR